MTLLNIVKQLQDCDYMCEAGSLVNNTAFIELVRLANEEVTPIDEAD